MAPVLRMGGGHWYDKHSKDIHYRWTTIALELGISREQVASACLSVNLETSPLPSSALGLQTVPKSLPPHCDVTFSTKHRQQGAHQAIGLCHHSMPLARFGPLCLSLLLSLPMLLLQIVLL